MTLPVASREQRHAVAEVIGRAVLKDRVVVDLAALDARLEQRSGCGGLADVVVAATGSPLRNRPEERVELERRRAEPLDLALRLVHEPWAEEWVAALRRSGILLRADDGTRLVADAARVLQELAEMAASARSRVELGARALGDAHALDEDTLLHNVVLRALAAAQVVDVPTTVAGRRALWERHGVLPDLVSATCLTLGLRPRGQSGMAIRLDQAAEQGDPVHLTTWELRRAELQVAPDTVVLVTENPRVLEAVAEHRGGEVAVVCTSGQPNTVVSTVLSGLAASGCRLRYHGDFDWPGIGITNRLIGQFGVDPWRMSMEDYEGGLRPGGVALTGSPVNPCWDSELGSAMRQRGRAVHEETQLADLVAGLGTLAE
ncbi:MAG: TIGR02679 family protein [Nocardioidaceae bacterium]